MARALSLVVRNLLFTIVVPGLGGAWAPWWILTRHCLAPGVNAASLAVFKTFA